MELSELSTISSLCHFKSEEAKRLGLRNVILTPTLKKIVISCTYCRKGFDEINHQLSDFFCHYNYFACMMPDFQSLQTSYQPMDVHLWASSEHAIAVASTSCPLLLLCRGSPNW